MTIIANEVASAGIGVDIGINGLQDLIKTNSVLKQMRDNAERIQNATVRLNVSIPNHDQVDEFYHELRGLHNVDSEIRPHIDNESTINNEMRNLSKPIDKHFKFTSSDGNLSSITERIRNATAATRHFGNTMSTVGRTGGSSFGHLNTHVNEAEEHGRKLANTGERLHGVFSGTFLGNAFNNAFTSFRTGAESALKSGYELVKTGQEADEAWRHIGLSSNSANSMVKQMDDIRDNAGMDEQSIQRMQKSFYTFTGSAPKARRLVNEVTDFGKASGESNQEIARAGVMLPRMLSAGKIRGQMFNRTFGQSGKLVNALAKASGRSSKSFRQLVDSGKMTSQQLQQYMWKASKGSSAALKQYTHTFGGQLTVIKGMETGAEEKFSHPFVNQLTKSLNQTEKSAGGLPKVQRSIQQLSASLGRKFGNTVGQAIGWIVKNQRPLMRIGTALGRIIKQMASGAWNEFSGMLELIGGHAGHSSGRLNGVSNALTAISKHTTAMRILGKVMLTTFAIAKLRKFKIAVFGASNGLGRFQRITRALIHPQATVLKLQEKFMTLQKLWAAIVGPIKAFWTAEKAGVGIQTALDAAMDANPIGAIVVGITAATAAVTGLVIGLRHLYKHSSVARHGMQAIGQAGVMAFKAITLPERMVLKLLGGIVGGVWKATSGLRHKLAGGFDVVKHHADRFYRGSLHNSNKWGNEFGSWIAGDGWKYRHNQTANGRSARLTHARIDNYRRNSSHQFRAYIAKNGQIYRSYHKGTTRISETTYKQREALRNRYYRRYTASLRKYEHNYRAYENKRSSLSRKYGKLRAMYSVKSLDLIEKRFRRLKSMVVGYAKTMFKGTQRWFRRLGTGAGHQFRGIYRDVRKYLTMSNREATHQFKDLYRTSRKWLNGSVNKYVRSLRYRYRRQRYYDRQLVRQAKRTGQAMYKLPLGWITRETRDLVRNWRHQRRSFITHNKRMTHAEVSHIGTMDEHLRSFRNRFEKMMSDLEDNIYGAWSKFWKKMHDRTGSGINSVEKPLNSGATNINSFVRAFGETTSPMHTMPEVSYATGTGIGKIRRPITQMVHATLNDGHDSPETNNQETVIHPNGHVEFPQGQNAQELLEPGTEVLNATETKLMGQMAHFAPTVHLSTGTGMLSQMPHITPTVRLATGTGLFGNIFGSMSSWIKNALSGHSSTDDYSEIWSQAKGKGYHRLLHILQKILGHSEQVISGFMGNSPRGYHGALGDITQGIYGQTANQVDSWWKSLMNLINQTLDQGGSNSKVTDYAMKNFAHIPYKMGAELHSVSDCSGMIDQVLRHFGINLPRTTAAMENDPSQLQYAGKSGGGKPGQIVLWGSGTGANGHVGLISRPGYAFQETPPYSRDLPLGYTTALPLHGFYNIRGLNSGGNKLSFKGANKGLMNFVKHQENPMLKWINKHLTPLLDFGDISGTAGAWTKSGTQAHHIAEDVFEAAEHLGLNAKHAAAIVGNAWHESAGFEHGLKVNQFGGGGGKGLFQFTGQGSRYGWSPLGQVKSILANASGGMTSSWEHSGGSPASLAHSFETIFERGSIPAFAARDAAAERAYQMFAGSSAFARGGRFHAGQLMTVGEHGEELIKPDVSGEVIPHNETKRIMNNNNSHPVKVEQHNTFNVSGNNSQSTIKEIDSRIDKANDTLADKIARLLGFDEGGKII